MLLADVGRTEVAAVVSSLPLLSMPADVVSAIVGGVFKALPDGAALVQFTDGPKPPVPVALRQCIASRRVARPAHLAQRAAGGGVDFPPGREMKRAAA